MLKEYRHIAKHIRTNLPEIVWIDRDKGQLQNPENFHSIQIPGCLLDFNQVQWDGMNGIDQSGFCSLTVSLVFRMPPFTYTEPDLQYDLTGDYDNYEELNERLYETIMKHPALGVRRSSRDYFTGEFYVTEQVYDCRLEYKQKQRTIAKPAPSIQANIKLPYQT